MVLRAKWSEVCGAKTPMMQRKGDKSQGAIAFTNTHRDDTYMLSKISQRQHMYNFTHYINRRLCKLLVSCLNSFCGLSYLRFVLSNGMPFPMELWYMSGEKECFEFESVFSGKMEQNSSSSLGRLRVLLFI